MKLKDLFKEKGIFSGKKVLAITMVLTFVGGMTLGAAASNHTWGSTGNVVYDNNGQKTTVFNKQDLIYLDDRISTIEAGVDTGKVNIAKKLNEWELPADKIVPTTNPSFNQINTALEYIKSIPNAGKEWKDASNNSYYVKEDGSITTNASEAKKNADGNVEPLKISAATAGNLSAGTSAWVDGSLVIGTGADNKNYYNRNAGSVSLLKVATYSVSTRGNNGSNSRTINLSGCRDYQNFAIDKNIFISGSCTRIIWCQPKGSYNASTGILTLSVSILGEQDANSVGTATATVVYF